MGKVFITDETNDSYTADVLPGGHIKNADYTTKCFVNSGTGSGCLVTGSCLLHSVVVAATANLGYLYLGTGLSDAVMGIAATCATALGSLISANRVAKIDLAARGSYIFDTVVDTALSYRLTGLDCDGITISYVKL
jgi:hypothetical protein